MKLILLIFFVMASQWGTAQPYMDSTLKWQKHYKQEFVSDTHSPLTAADTGNLRFFSANENLIFSARLIKTRDVKPFLMATHSGKTKLYKEYGTLILVEQKGVIDLMPMFLHRKWKLHLYQSIDLLKDSTFQDYLFLPFTDLTNGNTTYGGGRYLDLKTSDVNRGWIRLDFNRAYNPYCAYKEGYSCPIPPKENHLPFAVRAGEMMFGKAPKE